jgi:hypothetical protein
MLLLFDQDQRGHRLGYLTFIAAIFEERAPEILFGKNCKAWLRLVKSDHAFLSSADHYTIFAVSIGIFRKLLGKRTAALFIAAECLGYKSGVVSRLKRTFLCFSKTIGCLQAVTITPFDFSPTLAALSRAWVYDLQFFAPNLDIDPTPATTERPFIEQCRAETLGGLSLVMLLGNLGSLRGLGNFIQSASESHSIGAKLTFVAAGHPDPAAKKLLSESCGPKLISLPQRIGTAGFDELFKLADLIWCYFPPNYDYNSGIFCNAVRNEKPVLIRKNSLLHDLGVNHVKMTSAGWPGKPFPEDSVLLTPSIYSKDFPAKCLQRTTEILSNLIFAGGIESNS